MNLQVSCVVQLEVETSSSKGSLPDNAKGFSVSLPVAKSLPVQPAARCQDRVPVEVKDKNLMEECAPKNQSISAPF